MLYIVGKVKLDWVPFKDLPKGASFVTKEFDEVRIKYNDNGYYDKGWKGASDDETFARVEVREVIVAPDALEQPTSPEKPN